MYINLPRDRFGDSDEMANTLGRLVVDGIKTATCSAYDPSGKTPHIGEQTIIEDSKGRALCVIETTEVRIVPLDQVDAQFAYDEGEDDRSLKSWRREHQAFSSAIVDLSRVCCLFANGSR